MRLLPLGPSAHAETPIHGEFSGGTGKYDSPATRIANGLHLCKSRYVQYLFSFRGLATQPAEEAVRFVRANARFIWR